MPFNMELLQSKDKVIIKLQVVRKVINIYFTGKVEDIVRERERWFHLEKHFASAMPELGPEAGVSYTTDAYHHKKNILMLENIPRRMIRIKQPIICIVNLRLK